MKTKFRSVFHIILISPGCLQFAGYIFKNLALRGLGIAYCVAPLPTVFSTIGGVEGFQPCIQSILPTIKGKAGTIKLDRHIFSRFKGHYFLKQAYSLSCIPTYIKTSRGGRRSIFALCKRNIFSRFGIENKIKNPPSQIERSWV